MKKYLPLILFISISASIIIGTIIGALFYPEHKKQKDFPSNRIILLSSFEDRSIISNFFKKKNRFLPIEEDFYEIEWISPDLFNNYKNYPVVLMIKNKNREDSLLHNLFDTVFKNKSKKSKVNIIEDIYSDNQMIVGIDALDSLDLINTLSQYSESINKIDSKIENLILHKYKRIPVNEEVVKDIKNKYDIDIFIDHDYTVIKDYKDILWLGRGKPEFGDPYRWIIIREIDKSSSFERRVSIIQDTFNQIMSESNSIVISGHNDSKTYEYMTNNNYIIGGVYILSEIIKSGLGEGIIPTAGGPYISCILDRGTKRDLLIIGLLNSPDKNKMIYLKQLESVFKNIK